MNMAYKLIVENYGKIERAEIEVTPLTLFVGDNNSGKSYLLSLIWALLSEDNIMLCQDLDNLLKSNLPQFYMDLHNLITDKQIKQIEIDEKDIYIEIRPGDIVKSGGLRPTHVLFKGCSSKFAAEWNYNMSGRFEEINSMDDLIKMVIS